MDQIDSTNAHLLRTAAQLASGHCLVARTQSAGRGRQGRRWWSSAEHSLTFSLYWVFQGPVIRLSGLPQVVALGVLQALESLEISGLTLKWPNDLLRHGRKVAGILVELPPQPSRWGAVMGIGLNLALPEELADQIPAVATGLVEADEVPLQAELVLARILAALPALLRRFDQEGFAPFQAVYNRCALALGRQIRVYLPDHNWEAGEYAGVDPAGALLLRQGEKVRPFTGAEVSLRVDPCAP